MSNAKDMYGANKMSEMTPAQLKRFKKKQNAKKAKVKRPQRKRVQQHQKFLKAIGLK